MNLFCILIYIYMDVYKNFLFFEWWGLNFFFFEWVSLSHYLALCTCARQSSHWHAKIRLDTITYRCLFNYELNGSLINQNTDEEENNPFVVRVEWLVSLLSRGNNLTAFTYELDGSLCNYGSFKSEKFKNNHNAGIKVFFVLTFFFVRMGIGWIMKELIILQ